MTMQEADRVIQMREMLAAELPPAVRFREQLASHAETIVLQCRQLWAPHGIIDVTESFDGGLRVVQKENLAREIVKALQAAADGLRDACLRFTVGDEAHLLTRLQDLSGRLDAFAVAVPAMSTPFYTQATRNALQQIRLQMAPAGKVKR